MKKTLSLLLSIALLLTLFAGCAPKPAAPTPAPPVASGEPAEPAAPTGQVSQGVTDTELLIGNAYATSGAWAFVGIPVVDTIQAVIDRFNAEGGIRGRQVRLIHYDDAYDAAVGKTLIEKLVEEDKVFAISGLGGHVLPACKDYLVDYGIPVVNIASGLAMGYSEYDPGGAIFPVQPSTVTDGPQLLARALHESLFGPNKDEKLSPDVKIGLMYTNSEAGNDVYTSMMQHAEREGVTDRMVYEVVSPETYATAIQKMKDAGVGLVMYGGGTDTKTLIAAMNDAAWEIPFIGNYGTSTVQSYSPETYKPGRPIYATTWGDYSTEKAARMLEDIDDALTYNANLDEATRLAYADNNYARAGYASALVLVTGLRRLDESGLDLTWENFVLCMEDGPIGFGEAEWSYADGRRMGIETEAFFEYFVVTGADGKPEGAQATLRGFESVEQIMAK